MQDHIRPEQLMPSGSEELRFNLQNRPNVLLVKGTWVRRPELSLLLASSEYVVTVVANYRDLTDLPASTKFHIVLPSTSLSRQDLTAAAHLVRRQWPSTRIVILGPASTILDDPMYDDAMSRPFNAEDLLHRLAGLSVLPWHHDAKEGLCSSPASGHNALQPNLFTQILGVHVALARILIVDDDDMVRSTLCKILEGHGFQTVCAKDVKEALQYISSQTFDVLLSDLHMPGAGDGLTVVSAMRHANPAAVTLLLSAFPEMSAAANAILLQADEILVKPMKIPDLIQVITQRLAKGPLHKRTVEALGAILQRTTEVSIDNWYAIVETESVLTAVPLDRESRCAHLPQLFQDLTLRLQAFMPLGTKELASASAVRHGIDRFRQGYTASMMVEESRILQVTIFHTLQENLGVLDFSVLLLGIMTIADEVDSQLSQAMKSFTVEAENGRIAA